MYQSLALMWRDLEAVGINPTQYFNFADLLFASFYDTRDVYSCHKDLMLKKFVECSYLKELMVALSFWADKQSYYVPSATLGYIFMAEIRNRALSRGVSETTFIEELFAESNADNFIWRLEL